MSLKQFKPGDTVYARTNNVWLKFTYVQLSTIGMHIVSLGHNNIRHYTEDLNILSVSAYRDMLVSNYKRAEEDKTLAETKAANIKKELDGLPLPDREGKITCFNIVWKHNGTQLSKHDTLEKAQNVINNNGLGQYAGIQDRVLQIIEMQEVRVVSEHVLSAKSYL